jgi:DNA ligase (NAD+)
LVSVIAESVHDFFHNEAGRVAIRELKAVGIDPKFAKPQATAGALPLEGKTVVVTGTMEKLDRKEIEELIVTWVAKPRQCEQEDQLRRRG